jgi:hypothetical protein
MTLIVILEANDRRTVHTMIDEIDNIDEHLSSSQNLKLTSAQCLHTHVGTYLLGLFDRPWRVLDVHVTTQLLPLLQSTDICLTGDLVVEFGDQALDPHLALLLAAPFSLLGQATEVVP